MEYGALRMPRGGAKCGEQGCRPEWPPGPSAAAHPAALLGWPGTGTSCGLHGLQVESRASLSHDRLVGCLVAFLPPSRCLESRPPLLCPPPMRLALDRPVKGSRGCQGPCGPFAFLTRKEVGKGRAQNTKKGHLLPKEIGTKKEK